MILKNKLNPLYQDDIQKILNIECIMELKHKSILITGATGLIGIHLIDALMKLGDVTIFAVGRSKKKAQQCFGEYYNSSCFTFIEQDVQQPLPDISVDYVWIGASNTHPLAYSQYPIETIFINTKGTEHALNLAYKCHAQVLFLSSVEIYGNAIGEDVFTENYTGILNLATSRSCYTESKRVCEALCQSFKSEKGLSVKIARLSRVFGPTMSESDSKASSQFIKNALNGEDILLKSDGNQFFSYTYVTDAVIALLYILLQGKNGEAYNVSNENCNVHLKDFALICAESCGKSVIFDLPSEQEKKGYSVATQAILDNQKLIQIGFKPKYSIREAIFRTIEILGEK